MEEKYQKVTKTKDTSLLQKSELQVINSVCMKYSFILALFRDFSCRQPVLVTVVMTKLYL